MPADGLPEGLIRRGSLLPPVDDLRASQRSVGAAVALAAEARGLAQEHLDESVRQVHEAMWRPDYPRVEAKPL